MTPLEEEPEYRELVKRLRINASIYLVDQGVRGRAVAIQSRGLHA